MTQQVRFVFGMYGVFSEGGEEGLCGTHLFTVIMTYFFHITSIGDESIHL